MLDSLSRPAAVGSSVSVGGGGSTFEDEESALSRDLGDKVKPRFLLRCLAICPITSLALMCVVVVIGP